MSQKQFFKALIMSAFYFIAQTLSAIAPHKIEAQITDAYGAPYAEWNAWGVLGIIFIAVVAGTAFWMVQGEKSQRYDN